MKPKFEFKFGEKSTGNYIALQIGEIIQTIDGTFAMNQNFIPSCLNLIASEYLIGILHDLFGKLISKKDELSNQLKKRKPELSFNDLEMLVYLQLVNYYIPLLNQYYKSAQVHPELFYYTLISLAGQLTTFASSSKYQSENLPPYDHKNLTEIFTELQTTITDILNVSYDIPENVISIPLTREDSLYVGTIPENCLDAEFYLAVRKSMDETVIYKELPKKIKIADKNDIKYIRGGFVSGVKITYDTSPPRDISANTAFLYFKLIKDDSFWENISKSKSIAFALTDEFMSLELELMALLNI
jgi:type VI secretion system protein ImpJ